MNFESKFCINFLNYLREAICFCEIEKNDVRITFCNNSFFNVFKTKKTLILSKKVSECEEQIKKCFNLKQIKPYLSNKKFSLYLDNLNKHLNISIVSITESSFIAIIEDVTQKKFHESKFLIYKQFTDQANEGLVIADISGKIFYMNRFLKTLLSIGEEIKIDNILDIYKEDFKEKCINKIFPSLNSSKENQWKGETKILTHYNEQIQVSTNFFIINESPFTKYLANIIIDISKEEITNQLLTENEKKLRKFQEIANLGSWEIVLSDFSIKFSKEMYSILEISEDENIDFNIIKKIIDKSKTTINLNLIEEKKFEKLNLNNREIKIITRSKKTKYLKLDGEIIYDDKNEPIKLMGTCIDVTHNIELEKKNSTITKNRIFKSVFFRNCS